MNKTIEEVRDWLLKNRTDEHGDLNLNGLDFSDFDGDVSIYGMKVKRDLIQGYQEVEGNLRQNCQKVEGNLHQSFQEVGGHLYQSEQKVEEHLIQNVQELEGNLVNAFRVDNIKELADSMYPKHNKIMKLLIIKLKGIYFRITKKLEEN